MNPQSYGGPLSPLIVYLNYLFLNGPTPASFCLFLLFTNTKFTEETVGFSGIRTRIVRVEGEHADHFTTTTAQSTQRFLYKTPSSSDYVPTYMLSGLSSDLRINGLA